MEKRYCNKIQNIEGDFCCQKVKLDFHNMQTGKDSAWYQRYICILYLCAPSTVLELSSLKRCDWLATFVQLRRMMLQ